MLGRYTIHLRLHLSIGTFFSSTVWSYFVGGGWRTGDRRERERVCRNEGGKGERNNGEDDGGSGVRKAGCDEEESTIGKCNKQ